MMWQDPHPYCRTASLPSRASPPPVRAKALASALLSMSAHAAMTTSSTVIPHAHSACRDLLCASHREDDLLEARGVQPPRGALRAAVREDPDAGFAGAG